MKLLILLSLIITLGHASAEPGPIPAQILAEITAMAKREHPEDFTMQAYARGLQLNAYDVLRNYELGGAAGVPADVMARLIKQAKADHPGDFAMMVFTLQSQITAFRGK